MAKLKKQHMTIHWKAIVQDDASIPATEATLKEKATLVGRVGLMMLSVGTSAWRVRNSMNKVSRCLGLTCSADIGLLSISYTCIEETNTYTQSISIPNTGVNTHKLMQLELFMREFPERYVPVLSNKFMRCWIKSEICLPTIPHGNWDWLLPLPVVPLPFCWAAVWWKCAVPFSGQGLATSSESKCWRESFPYLPMLLSALRLLVSFMCCPSCWHSSCSPFQKCIRQVTSVPCSL